MALFKIIVYNVFSLKLSIGFVLIIVKKCEVNAFIILFYKHN